VRLGQGGHRLAERGERPAVGLAQAKGGEPRIELGAGAKKQHVALERRETKGRDQRLDRRWRRHRLGRGENSPLIVLGRREALRSRATALALDRSSHNVAHAAQRR
jgi:hypothetical protein